MGECVNMTEAHERARNYFRLVKLTMIEGTKAIRTKILKLLPNGLHMILSQKQEKMRSLNHQNKRVISNRQLSILYPENGLCNLSHIDMTLWCILGRNLITLPKKAHWGDDEHPPLPGQEEWYHDVARIRLTRNNLFHVHKPELDEDTYGDFWNYIVGALSRLDSSIDFDAYKNAEYDCQSAREFEIQVKEQVLQETNDTLRAELGNRRRMYCIVILFCVVMVTVVSIAVLLLYLLLRPAPVCGQHRREEITGLYGGLTFILRDDWGAEEPSGKLEDLNIPVPYVEYTHTAYVAQCKDCCLQVRNIQYLHMHKRGWDDIAFHFLIDNDGVIYEGRSPNKVPSAVHGWNKVIESIALLGNFMYEKPTDAALTAFNGLLYYLMDKGLVTKNFTLYAMCEIHNETDSPGIELYKRVNSNDSNYEYFKKHAKHNPNGSCFFNTSQRSSFTSEEFSDLV